MKFAHKYKEALQKEGYPPEWIESALPYAQLKKCVKKVQSELRDLGLDPETLSHLVHESGDIAARRGSGAAFQYEIDGDKFAVDAVLSAETRAYLEQLAVRQGGNGRIEEIHDDAPPESGKDDHTADKRLDQSIERPGFKRIEVPLTFDAEFFDMLHFDVLELDKLQRQQQEVLTENIEALSTQLVRLAQPSKLLTKTDLYRWRELFALYLDGAIFFSTNEQDHGTRDSATAARQLEWFQKEVVQRSLLDRFKLPESRHAFSQFICINIKLLQNLKYLEINQKAISKIIKKFDKRTKLGATKTFPKLIQSDAIMSGSIAKAACAQITQDIVKVVPQLDDFLCPVCFSIVWRPVKLKCKHVYCIRCAIKLERTRRPCPLCRKFTLVNLTIDDLDAEMTAYLKKWFPKEVREKQIANETEQGREDLGPGYVHPSQQKCAIM
ncbi:RING-14 protein [Acephala macrosclerotiorum]|nr:RING-14 protein [Acephala macrosclerotiorum]